MAHFICIHGHFYQPPRENPWIEAVEAEDSAWPFHDWNERVDAECYAPNAASRILDDHGRIDRIVNNYARISFNFGPTLLAWLEANDPETYAGVIEADRDSRERFSGHGSALAQAYNHMILPLANPRDRRTQIIWGIADFCHRFGREPEGLWLPETAVDVATLEELAACKIAFTILAPHQAARFRRIGERDWQEVNGAKIDPTRPYLAALPSGRRLALFFYDGPISRAIAFEGLLSNGETFVARLKSGFNAQRDGDQLVHIATDGESYGHHHRFGDMALAWALGAIERDGQPQLTNYGEYLAAHPPTWEAEIVECTSWSCSHGIERWRSDCGCNSGAKPGWRQTWRGSLRAALDWLRDTLATTFEHAGAEFFTDVWAARDAYIEVILDRSPEHLEAFLTRHARRPLAATERIAACKLLEMQRHTLLMFTSCGWFFDDIAGIETVQILKYAGRALSLAQDFTGEALEPQFLARLATAPSNLASAGDGAQIYLASVKPAVADLYKIGAHWAITTLFNGTTSSDRLFAFGIERRAWQVAEAGRSRLALGQLGVRSEVTGESADLFVGVLHLGDHNLTAGVRDLPSTERLGEATSEISHAFERGDVTSVVRGFDRHFDISYSLKDLFRDQQKRVLHTVLETTLEGAIAQYRQIYDAYAPLMRFLAELPGRMPRTLEATAEFVLNHELKRAFRAEPLDGAHIHALLDEVRRFRITLDAADLGFTLRRTLRDISRTVARDPLDLANLQALSGGVGLAIALPFDLDLRPVANGLARWLPHVAPDVGRRAAAGESQAQEWLTCAGVLAELLHVRWPQSPA